MTSSLEITGISPQSHQLRERVRMVSELKTPVCILGHPGTEIDTVARMIHITGSRAEQPFMRLDCSIHSSESLQRRLFGVETGFPADDAPAGCALRWAKGGTLFLDDVDELSLHVQKNLVDYLKSQDRLAIARQASQVTGGWETSGQQVEQEDVSIRLIVASRVDLAEMVQTNQFRGDLFQYVTRNVIAVPSLKERACDIGLITESILRQLAVKEGRHPLQLSQEAFDRLESYDWPGNVDELEDVLARVQAVERGTTVTAEMISSWLATPETNTETEPEGLSLKEMERKLIEATLARFGGHRERTAKALKIGVRTLSGKLRDYGYPPRGGPGSNRRAA